MRWFCIPSAVRLSAIGCPVRSPAGRHAVPFAEALHCRVAACVGALLVDRSDPGVVIRFKALTRSSTLNGPGSRFCSAASGSSPAAALLAVETGRPSPGGYAVQALADADCCFGPPPARTGRRRPGCEKSGEASRAATVGVEKTQPFPSAAWPFGGPKMGRGCSTTNKVPPSRYAGGRTKWHRRARPGLRRRMGPEGCLPPVSRRGHRAVDRN